MNGFHKKECTGGRAAWTAALSQIFAKVDLLPIENDSEKKKIVKEYKLVQILRKLLITILLSTSCNT